MSMYKEVFQTITNHSESEVVEFKKAENNFDFDDLGKYFSALSNEANLRKLDFAWLIFGYDEKKHEIVGTSYKNGEGALNNLKHDFSQHTTDGQTFREIIPIEVDGKRILMFKIPASPRNIVMKWKGIAYGRDGESLKPLNQSKQDEIRRQTPAPDWSAEIVPDATIDDLDEVAIAKARKMFKKVHGRIPAEEVNRWSTEEFLSKCELMVNGKLTRAAIILLGKIFSDSKLRPAVAEVTWTLRDENQDVVDYEHFSVPFILTVDEILAKIHNLTLREMPGGTLFPDTMKQYDDYTIREALHNCIAHQDYTLRQRINFVENPGFLYYANGGSFIPGTLENALATNGPQRFFRNACLCKAMVHFNMIDTVSRGIKKMFTEQMERRFPMPDYEIDNEKKEVAVRIYGNTINERYTKLLKDNNIYFKTYNHESLNKVAENAIRTHQRITGIKKETPIGERIQSAKAVGDIIGNTPYKAISDKSYLKYSNAIASQIADKLQQNNVAFSGRVYSNLTTFTVNKKDLDKLRSIAENLTRSFTDRHRPQLIPSFKQQKTIQKQMTAAPRQQSCNKFTL